MAIQFSTLASVPHATLTRVFNEAFANYFVPLQLTEDQLSGKFIADNMRHDRSIGAFDDGELIGFIFHGIDTVNGQVTAYNGGTGVLPAYRGQQLTQQMYAAVLPLLREAGVAQSVLEVVTANERAIRVYSSVGFTRERKVDCYKGVVRPVPLRSGCTIRATTDDVTGWAKAWGEAPPTWQNNTASAMRQGDAVVTLVAQNGDVVKGFLLFNTKNGKLIQLAVEPGARRRGIAADLIATAAGIRNELITINVDESLIAGHELLRSMGLQPFLSQYEMRKAI